MAKKQANQPDKPAAKAPEAAAPAAVVAAPAGAPAVDPAADVAPVVGQADADNAAVEGADMHSEAEAVELEKILEGSSDEVVADALDKVDHDLPITSRSLVDGPARPVEISIDVDPALGVVCLDSLAQMQADVRLRLQARLGCLFTLEAGRAITTDGRIFDLAMNEAGDKLEARLP